MELQSRLETQLNPNKKVPLKTAAKDTPVSRKSALLTKQLELIPALSSISRGEKAQAEICSHFHFLAGEHVLLGL